MGGFGRAVGGRERDSQFDGSGVGVVASDRFGRKGQHVSSKENRGESLMATVSPAWQL